MGADNTIASNSSGPGWRRVERRRDDNTIATGINNRIVFEPDVCGRGETNTVIQRMNDGVAGNGDIRHSTDALAIAAIADVHRRLSLIKPVATRSHNYVSHHGCG